MPAGSETGAQRGEGVGERSCRSAHAVAAPVISNLFSPQHLSDAKKAQQNLESSFKHLESVSQYVVYVPHHHVDLLQQKCDCQIMMCTLHQG